MATLYKRATPAQQKILRAVEGAVKNAAHAHPEFRITDKFARSIAKRAAGTLTAQWPEVLARQSTGSESERAGICNRARSAASPASAQLVKPKYVSTEFSKSRPKGAVSTVERRSLFFSAQTKIGKLARQARKAGHLDREAAFVEVLKMLAEETK